MARKKNKGKKTAAGITDAIKKGGAVMASGLETAGKNVTGAAKATGKAMLNPLEKISSHHSPRAAKESESKDFEKAQEKAMPEAGSETPTTTTEQGAKPIIPDLLDESSKKQSPEKKKRKPAGVKEVEDPKPRERIPRTSDHGGGGDISKNDNRKPSSFQEHVKKGGAAIAQTMEKTGKTVSQGTEKMLTSMEDVAKATSKTIMTPVEKISQTLASKEKEIVAAQEEGDKTEESTELVEGSVQNSHRTISDHLKKGGAAIAHGFEKTGKTVSKGTGKVMHSMEDAAKVTGKVIMSPFEKMSQGNAAKTRSVPGEEDMDDFAAANGENVVGSSFPAVEADATLQSMTTIIKKRVAGVTVAKFHEVIWENPEFYKEWLQASGKDQISVQNWDTIEGGPEFPSALPGLWKDDHTQYDKKRVVDFQFTRTTHLYTGPPVAQVKQTHLRRLTDERCIVQMQIEMDGIPFANCFNVQIRWVATRAGSLEMPVLQLEIGLFVNFVEQTLLAGKIRSGTSEETTKAQKSLMQAVLDECGKHVAVGAQGAGVMVVEDEEADIEEEVAQPPSSFFAPCLAFPKLLSDIFKGPNVNDPLSLKADRIQTQLDRVVNLIDARGDMNPSLEAKVDSELTDIHESLALIEKYLKMDRLGQHQGSRALLG